MNRSATTLIMEFATMFDYILYTQTLSQIYYCVKEDNTSIKGVADNWNGGIIVK